jgi:NAD(P)-dependent dehydrogenase (short-subunit alcohol dehydrogenase family)
VGVHPIKSGDEMKLKNKVALITGAGSGIGRETAILFAKEGAKVVVADIVKEAAEETVKLIKEAEGEVIFVLADVTKAIDVQKMIETAVNHYGRLDILFNNAGVNIMAPISETSEELWDKIININLKGVFLGCKYAAPVMIKQGGGVIINTASTFAFVGALNFSAYCASKGGVAAFTRALALELAPYKIRVNCICPGTIETPLVRKIWEKSGKPEEMRESRLKLHPIGRLGKPEDVANAALFLASDDSSFITGTALFVDGGYTAQ